MDILPPVPPENSKQSFPEVVDVRNVRQHLDRCQPLITTHHAIYQQALLTRQRSDRQAIKERKRLKELLAATQSSTALRSLTERHAREQALFDYIKDRGVCIVCGQSFHQDLLATPLSFLVVPPGTLPLSSKCSAVRVHACVPVCAWCVCVCASVCMCVHLCGVVSMLRRACMYVHACAYLCRVLERLRQRSGHPRVVRAPELFQLHRFRGLRPETAVASESHGVCSACACVWRGGYAVTFDVHARTCMDMCVWSRGGAATAGNELGFSIAGMR